MLAHLQNILSLTQTEILISFAVVLLAGMVRGFAGFAMSALIMAALALIMAPVTLIPICFLLEMVASLMMFRGGFKLADKRMALTLALGTFIGTPIGLMATILAPPDVSRTVALCVILILAMMQLFKVSPAFLSTRLGLYLAGLIAGIAAGLASVGGMVVALFVLAQQSPAPRMRATLVMYLFMAMFSSIIWLTVSGVMTQLAIQRALVFSPAVVLGVILGTLMFRPSLERFYKRFCLSLLMSLAIAGLVRLSLV